MLYNSPHLKKTEMFLSQMAGYQNSSSTCCLCPSCCFWCCQLMTVSSVETDSSHTDARLVDLISSCSVSWQRERGTISPSLKPVIRGYESNWEASYDTYKSHIRLSSPLVSPLFSFLFALHTHINMFSDWMYHIFLVCFCNLFQFRRKPGWTRWYLWYPHLQLQQ